MHMPAQIQLQPVKMVETEPESDVPGAAWNRLMLMDMRSVLQQG